jgi:hypothetical protein
MLQTDVLMVHLDLGLNKPDHIAGYTKHAWSFESQMFLQSQRKLGSSLAEGPEA